MSTFSALKKTVIMNFIKFMLSVQMFLCRNFVPYIIKDESSHLKLNIKIGNRTYAELQCFIFVFKNVFKITMKQIGRFEFPVDDCIAENRVCITRLRRIISFSRRLSD